MKQVAVLMATNSVNRYFYEAVTSVLQSDLTHLILIDDGIEALDLAGKLSQHSDRITILRHAYKRGLTTALNYGLGYILTLEYPYIARMDADDICAPARFREQIEYLKNNPDLDGVGSWARYIAEDASSIQFHFCPPENQKEIRIAMRYNNCIAHPTWLFRREVFEKTGGYDEAYRVAQDYEFLWRCLKLGFRFQNVPKYLIDYRMSIGGISSKRRRRQIVNRLKVQIKYYSVSDPHSAFGVLKTLSLLLLPVRSARTIKAILDNIRRR